MKRYCIIANADKDIGYELSKQICRKFDEYNKECIIINDFSELSDEFAAAIVLGGDGTMLQAAKDLAELDIPMLGINKGTLGFMTEVDVLQMNEAIKALIDGNYSIDERIMLKGEIKSDKAVIKDDVCLNDIIVARSGFSRIISTKVYVNGDLVNSYRGDGVIISTPTGSTGYNLSAGGPIVKPDSELMIITPICSHALSSRSIIVSSKDSICVEIGRSKKTQKEEVIVNFDGREGIKLKTGDKINIRMADNVTSIINIEGKSFFDVIREKFNSTF